MSRASSFTSAAPPPPPDLSVVVPLYNCLPLTLAMLASLRATLPAGLRHELILVDDGSTDGTREWLGSVAETNPPVTGDLPIRIVLNERNLGFAGANNRGIAEARGKFLALLNNDLILLPRWLEPMLETHRALGDRAGIIGNIQLDMETGAIDHAGIVIGRQGKPMHARTLPREKNAAYRVVPAVTGACLLVAHSLWRELGGFDDAFVNGGEDIDLCFRARAAGRDNAVALRSVVRHHVSSSSGRKLRDEENSYLLARRWHRQFLATEEAPLEWCRHHVAAAFREPHQLEFGTTLRALAYVFRLRKTPPAAAFAGLEAGMAQEFARWERMFPDKLQSDRGGRNPSVTAELGWASPDGRPD